MTKKERMVAEYEGLPPEEKREFSSFHDYLGSMAWCLCERCGDAFEYDQVNDMGHCGKCGEHDDE